MFISRRIFNQSTMSLDETFSCGFSSEDGAWGYCLCVNQHNIVQRQRAGFPKFSQRKESILWTDFRTIIHLKENKVTAAWLILACLLLESKNIMIKTCIDPFRKNKYLQPLTWLSPPPLNYRITVLLLPFLSSYGACCSCFCSDFISIHLTPLQRHNESQANYSPLIFTVWFIAGVCVRAGLIV